MASFAEFLGQPTATATKKLPFAKGSSFSSFLKTISSVPTQPVSTVIKNPPSKSPFNPNTPGNAEFNTQLDMRTNQSFWQKTKSLFGDIGKGIAQTSSLVAGKESLPYQFGTGIYNALAKPSEGVKQVEQAGEVNKLPPVAKQIAQGAIRFFVPGVEKFATQIGVAIGSKGKELPSSLDAFMSATDASLTFGSVGAVKVMQDILGAGGDVLVNKSTTLRLTPEQLRVKLVNGEIKTPQARQVATEFIKKGLTIEAQGTEPRGGITQKVGEAIGGEIKPPSPKIKFSQTGEPITGDLNKPFANELSVLPKNKPFANEIAIVKPKTAPETTIVAKIKPDWVKSDDLTPGILEELQNAEAGSRIFQGYGSDLTVSGIKSTFPDWIPENLRLSSIVKPVAEHLQNGTLPTFKKQIELYNYIGEMVDAEARLKDEVQQEINQQVYTNGEVDPEKVNNLINKTQAEETALIGEINDQGTIQKAGQVADKKKIAGETPSKIAQSIEAKAIEQKLTQGFEGIAGYDKITIKDQAEKAAGLFDDPEKVMQIIRGDESLPEGLRGTALITAAEEYIKKTGDARMAYALANSPLVSETSVAAQELRLAAEREPDNATMKLQEIKKAREARAEKRASPEKRKVAKSAKAETEKVNLSPDELKWDNFLASITC